MTREERIAHIDLNAPCIFPKNPSNKKYRQALIVYTDWNPGNQYDACHLCPNDSQNGMCANPLHLYWGTESENKLDMSPDKRNPHNYPNWIAALRLPATEKQKEAASIAQKKRWENAVEVQCIHCGYKTKNPGMLKRWHGDNCNKKNSGAKISPDATVL